MYAWAGYRLEPGRQAKFVGQGFGVGVCAGDVMLNVRPVHFGM